MQSLTRYIPVFFVLIWSTGFIGAKFGLPYMEPFLLLVVRYALVLLLFGLAVAILRGRRLSPGETGGQMLVGSLVHGVYLGGVFYAISVGLPAGLTAIIVGLQPILTAVLGHLWLGQTVRRVQMAGLGLGFAGVLLVILGTGLEPENGALNVPGLIAALAGLFGISLGTVLQKRLGAGVPLLSGAVAQYAGALAVTLPLTLLLETGKVELTWTLALTMGWLVLGLSVLAILLLMVMIRAGEVARVTSFFYLVPPLTMLQAWAFFGERISAMSGLGTVLAVFGVYLVIRPAPASAPGQPRSSRA